MDDSMTPTVIERVFDGVSVLQRGDGYWNATSMCKANGKQWNESARIQAFKKAQGFADNHALQAYFNRRLQAIVKKHGKHMEGWDEVLDPDLSKDIVIQSSFGLGEASGVARTIRARRYRPAVPADARNDRGPRKLRSAGALPEKRLAPQPGGTTMLSLARGE